MTLLSVLGNQLAAGAAEGVVIWPHVGVILFWFLLMGLVGSFLGLLKAREGRADAALSSKHEEDCGLEQAA